ncbi:MAG: hypothetical protein AAGB22_13655 [Bacteroidota bacterium]
MFINKYSYGFRAHEDLIREHIGKRFGILERLRMGGAGSERMAVAGASEGMKEFVLLSASITYANIELRPNGLVVILAKDIRRLAWVIPYTSLSLFQSGTMNLYAGQEYLQLQCSAQRHYQFFHKLQRTKALWISAHSLPV